jgi:hypothetical protein
VLGADPLPTTGPCSFNPDLIEEPLSGNDRNHNGVDDTVDILLGTSPDTNGNGIPDESESCVAPEFVTKPEAQTLAPGQTLTLSAAAEGTGPLSYQWRRDGVLLPGATMKNLTISPADAVDTGYYDVVASNGCGVTTSVAVPVRIGGALPPVLTLPGYSVNGFVLSVSTQGGVDYVLEYKDSLSDPEWTPLATWTGDGSIQVLQDPLPHIPTRFYRVRVP